MLPKNATQLFSHYGVSPCPRNVDGGVLYVGDQRAARDATLLTRFWWFSFLPKTIFSSNVTTFSLARLGIRAVVNCTPNLPNHHEKLLINEKPHEEKAINKNHHKEQFINKNHHKEKAISYLRFPIGKWKANSGEDDNLLQTFLATFLQLNIFKTKNLPSNVSTMNLSNRKTKNSSLQFVGSHLSAGHSVLIHCMAGAHRFFLLWLIFFFGFSHYLFS